MSRRNQIVLLGLLMVVLAGVAYWNWHSSPELIGATSSANEKVLTLNVQNPSLHLDRLEQIRKLEYTGTHRNIFSASLPPPPPPKIPDAAASQAAPAGPPPLAVPFTFFGMATDPRTGHRRAFFTDGDDVFIVAEGGTLLNRFRLVHIGNNSVDLEEISSGRHATLTMEQPAPES
jgi:hypothetical protein